jgi:hypothetical protein
MNTASHTSELFIRRGVVFAQAGSKHTSRFQMDAKSPNRKLTHYSEAVRLASQGFLDHSGQNTARDYVLEPVHA